MGSQIPKQFIEIGDKSILDHTIDKFKSVFPDIEIIVVLPNAHFDFVKRSDCKLVEGGDSRFQSVKNGLKAATGDLIAVHDAVRPFVSKQVILDAFEMAELVGAAVPVLPVKDSLRQLTPDESIAVDRSKYLAVQTPQVFKSNVLRLAYEQSFHEDFTDDASVVESCGQDISLVEGNEENIKITTPFDLKLAKVLLTT